MTDECVHAPRIACFSIDIALRSAPVYAPSAKTIRY